MISEIPSRISTIEPEYLPVDLGKYTQSGMLFPNEDSVKSFRLDRADDLSNIPDNFLTPPHVFVFSLKGIESYEKRGLVEGLGFIFFHMKGQKFGDWVHAYSIFNNISSKSTGTLCLWERFRRTLQGMHKKPLVIACQEGITRYQLMGNEDKFLRYEPIWRILKEETWVLGEEIAERNPKPTSSITLQDLHRMHRNGLILQANYKNRAYFRSLV